MAEKLVQLFVNGLCFRTVVVDFDATITVLERGIDAPVNEKPVPFALPKGNIAIAKCLQDLWLKIIKLRGVKEIEYSDEKYTYYTYYFNTEILTGWGECDWCSPYTAPYLVEKGFYYRQYKLDNGKWVLEQRQCKNK